jgi:hypothetical protein
VAQDFPGPIIDFGTKFIVGDPPLAKLDGRSIADLMKPFVAEEVIT